MHSGKPQKAKKERGREGGGGAKCSTGSNEPQKYFGRSDHVEALSQLGPLRSRKGMSQLGIPKMGQKSSYVRPRPPTLAASCSVSGQWIRSTYTRSTGPREALCGLIPGWHEAKHTHGYAYRLDSGATRRPRVPFPKGTSKNHGASRSSRGNRAKVSRSKATIKST